MRTAVRGIVATLEGISLLALTAWGLTALFYLAPAGKHVAVGVYLSAALYLFFAVKSRVTRLKLFTALFVTALAVFLSERPSQSRDWQPDVASLPYADIKGDVITIHNIRNARYRSETDYDVSYYDKTVKLSELSGLDMFISFWGPTLIAHTILSFEFKDGTHIGVSVETRKEKDEVYSATAGFFRQYELIYIVADERDIVGLRTNYRKEDVYLYRFNPSPEKMRTVFLAYLRTINRLHERPTFYNALLDNCTTNIFFAFRVAPPYPKLSLGVLLPGLLDQQLYEFFKKKSGTQLTFEEFKTLSRINHKASVIDENFSDRIREGLPTAVH